MVLLEFGVRVEIAGRIGAEHALNVDGDMSHCWRMDRFSGAKRLWHPCFRDNFHYADAKIYSLGTFNILTLKTHDECF